MGTIKTTNIQTITGSGTLTLGTSGETITIPSGVTVTNNGTQTGFGGTNTPAFSVYRNSNQTLSDNATTKIQFETKSYDTNSAYDNSTNYRFTVPSGEGGKYFFYFRGRFQKNEIAQYYVGFYKNGSEVAQRYVYSGNTGSSIGTILYFSYDVSCTLNLSANDYIEAYVKADSTDGGSTTFDGGSIQNEFTGYKLVE